MEEWSFFKAFYFVVQTVTVSRQLASAPAPTTYHLRLCTCTRTYHLPPAPTTWIYHLHLPPGSTICTYHLHLPPGSTICTYHLHIPSAHTAGVSTYLSHLINPSTHPPIHPSTHPTIHTSTHPPIHPSIRCLIIPPITPITPPQTVGYGDPSPGHDSTKIVLCFFIMISVVMLTVALNNLGKIFMSYVICYMSYVIQYTGVSTEFSYIINYC
jgi:hypothetical protein